MRSALRSSASLSRPGDMVKKAHLQPYLTSSELKALHQKVRELQREFPNAVIEVWSFDEHRVGLKPILRRVWAPIGERPIESS